MKIVVSKSRSLLYLLFSLFFIILIIISSLIKQWYLDGTIYWIASDAPVYYEALEIFTIEEFFNNWHWFVNLFLVFNVLIIGDLTLYLIVVMILCLFIVKYSLKFIEPKYRLFYLLLLFIFPYANITFSSLIRDGLYIVIYPFKYIILMLSKTYQGFNIGFNFSNRPQDLHEFFVSFLSLLVFSYSLYIYLFKRKSTDTRFFYLGLFCPILLQFSDIFHWRYSAFVYVFFIFYIISYKNGLNYFINIKRKKRFYE